MIKYLHLKAIKSEKCLKNDNFSIEMLYYGINYII